TSPTQSPTGDTTVRTVWVKAKKRWPETKRVLHSGTAMRVSPTRLASDDTCRSTLHLPHSSPLRDASEASADNASRVDPDQSRATVDHLVSVRARHNTLRGRAGLLPPCAIRIELCGTVLHRAHSRAQRPQCAGPGATTTSRRRHG